MVIRTAEILCVGTELLLGDIVNTNAAFLARRLAGLGISVYHQSVVGDHPDRLTRALEDAFSGQGRPAADLVVLSGGLGPTYDDLTKETVASLFGRPMVLHQASLDSIRDYFTRLGRSMSANNEKQAMMPEGAVVFPNHHGTAPGLAVSDGHRTAVLLPGPPHELEPMFDEEVTPWLRQYTDGVLISRNIHIGGMGEAEVESRLHDLMVSATNPTLAPYCQSGEVRLRVTARAGTQAEAESLCEDMVKLVMATEIGAYVFNVSDDNAVFSVEKAVVETLTCRGLTLACAESCTGGMIGQRVTGVPGASAVFVGGCITYTNDMKIKLLGVDPNTIKAHTEVSAETAAEMAAGARRMLGSDIAVSTTGYAGPGGGTPENPVGTVYVGIATAKGVNTLRLSYSPTKPRNFIREAASTRALAAVLSAVKEASEGT